MRPVQLDIDSQGKPLREIGIIEPLKGHWLNNNSWGDAYNGDFPLTYDKIIPIAELNDTPGPPRVYTVQLFRDMSAAEPLVAEVKARITYGVGAVRHTFDIDYLAGCQFSLVASYIKVEAITYSPVVNFNPAQPLNYLYNPATAAGPTARLRIGASFGAYAVATQPKLTLSSAYDQSQATIAQYDIPNFARAFIVRCSGVQAAGPNPVYGSVPTTLTGITAQITNEVGAAYGIFDTCIFAGPAGTEGIPLPAGASRITVSAGGIVAPAGNFSRYVQWILAV